MFLVGLTGNIGTGKSTVLKAFLEKGVPVLSADVYSRQAVEPNRPAWHQIQKAFGPAVLMKDGSNAIDRKALAALVFNDPAKRKQLERIVWPKVYQYILWDLLRHLVRGKQFCVIELPLLFESGAMVRLFNSIIVVHCGENIQIDRVIARDGGSEEEVRARIQAQMPSSEKVRRATYVIDTNGSLDLTLRQVDELYEIINSKMDHWKLRLIIAGIGGAMLWFLQRVFLR